MFLYGMSQMGSGLEKISGGKLEQILEKLTNNPLKGVLVGALVTAVIQSSSATTVMVVGFVNSGIMNLSQSIGIIMGANIGTTVTSWILSLTGLQGDNIFIKLCKPDSFAPILAFIGIIMYMFSKRNKKKDIGSIMIGFAVLMFGMTMMSGAVAPLANIPEFSQILLLFSNPVLGVLAGAILTAVIQSSSASVGILQALSATGQMTVGTALPIIMGQNIGTCATALISCIGASKNAKRAAMVHLYFNVIGTVLFLCGFYAINSVIPFHFLEGQVNAVTIAIIHTTFNLLTTAVLLPFNKYLGKLAEKTIKDKKEDREEIMLDERFLSAPSFAIEQCKRMAVDMAVLAKKTVLESISQVYSYKESEAMEISEEEERIDKYEDVLGGYLVKLSSKELSEMDGQEISKLLHSIGDYERVGDHAVNILRVAREMYDKEIHFSKDAIDDLKIIENAVDDILTITTEAFSGGDPSLAFRVEPLEQVIDKLELKLKDRHINRLKEGACTIELGFIFSDLLSNYERISDHCSNIAVYLMQTKNSDFETHSYLHEYKSDENEMFTELFGEYKNKYSV